MRLDWRTAFRYMFEDPEWRRKIFVGGLWLVLLPPVSVLATAIAFTLGLAAPWGIFWSYLVIVYAFNEALFHAGTPMVRQRFRDSLFARREGPDRRAGA